MADNRFNTDVLRRSVGRGTLLDYAQLPDVQPGPSTGAQIADSLFQFLEGSADRALQSKKLDLQAQMNAVQIDTAQQNLKLNQDKNDFYENTTTDNRLIETIKESEFAISESTIDQMKDPNLKKIYREGYDELKPIYNEKEAFEQYAEKKTINDIIQDKAGNGMGKLDAYMGLNIDDKRFNIKKDDRIVEMVKDYTDNKGYYNLVSNEESFKKVFGFPPEDKSSYLLYRGLSAKKGQDLIVQNLKSKNTNLDENRARNNINLVGNMERTITNLINNKRTYSGMITNTAYTSKEKEKAQKQIDIIDDQIKILNEQVRQISKPIKLGAGATTFTPEQEKNRIVSTERVTDIDGKSYDVNYNSLGDQVGDRIFVPNAPVDTSTTKTDQTQVNLDTSRIINEQKKRQEELLNPNTSKFDSLNSVLTADENRRISSKLNSIWIKKGKPLDDNENPMLPWDNPAIVKMLDRFGYNKKLENLNSPAVSP